MNASVEAEASLAGGDEDIRFSSAKGSGSIATSSSPGVGIGEEIAVYDEPRELLAGWPGDDGCDFRCGA